jgi:hypothetical protein
MGKGSPGPQKPRMSRSKLTVILYVLFDWKSIVNHEFVRLGQTVNRQLCQEVLARLRAAVRRKRPELCQNQTWMLHHDNAPARASLLISGYLAKLPISVVFLPPYSPDLDATELFLFAKFKTTLKRHNFQTVRENQENAS